MRKPIVAFYCHVGNLAPSEIEPYLEERIRSLKERNKKLFKQYHMIFIPIKEGHTHIEMIK